MRPWPAVDLPRLPAGGGGDVRVHDTASGELVPVARAGSGSDGPLRLFVCGITPYDATHLGHAATYVAFDLLQRAALDAGRPVHYVQNVTDVDDPLLERAARDGVDWRELAAEQAALFGTDMAALRVLPPRDYVGAVEAIPTIVSLVERLQARGAAYELDGDVYFPVDADPRFGSLAHLDRAAMLALAAERGGDPQRAGKKDPLDCLLWQGERPGEPSWPSPYGPGRPGWHVECAAIALDRLGPVIDVQGGGSDLAFPHHECGAAEARLATGEPGFARAYVHTGLVGYQGEKMSKSRGNLVFVHRLRERADPMAVRLVLLAHHYRTDWTYTADELTAAQRRLAAWRAAVDRPAGPDGAVVLGALRAALRADLDAPAALAAVDAWAAQPGSDAAAPGGVRAAVDALLGVAL